jgi:GT2 family glycosyltransferase
MPSDSLRQLPVTVVIPTWQRASWLERCLKSVLEGAALPSAVLVVGRDEDVDAHAVVDRLASDAPVSVCWLTVDRPGHVAPVQTGLGRTATEFIAFIDDDAEARENWLAELLAPFADPLVACVGGRVDVPGFHGKVGRNAGQITWYGKHIGNVGLLQVPEPIEVMAVPEGNSAWRVEDLRSLEFDPVLDHDDAMLYGLDLTLQTIDNGRRVMFTSSAEILHHVAPRDPALERTPERRTFNYARNYTYIAMKHLRGLRRAAFLIWWWTIGDRVAPGLVQIFAVHVLLRGRTHPMASMRGRAIVLQGRRRRVQPAARS